MVNHSEVGLTVVGLSVVRLSVVNQSMVRHSEVYLLVVLMAYLLIVLLREQSGPHDPKAAWLGAWRIVQHFSYQSDCYTDDLTEDSGMKLRSKH